MAGVAARDPEPLVSGDAPHDRDEVEDHAEDPGPAIVDAQRPPDVLLDEALESSLDDGRRDLLSRELRVERDVPEAAGDDPTVQALVPVVEAVPTVVRNLEQHLLVTARSRSPGLASGR